MYICTHCLAPSCHVQTHSKTYLSLPVCLCLSSSFSVTASPSPSPEPPSECPSVPTTQTVISNDSALNCTTYICDDNPNHMIVTCNGSSLLTPVQNVYCSFDENPFQSCKHTLVCECHGMSSTLQFVRHQRLDS